MIELTLPAGSYDAAIEAFTHGADGVYLGLQQFSARKGAKNFTLDELSRLKTLAVSEGKKIYVTVNTILTEGEIETLLPLLTRLELLQVDGIIVQDLGLGRLISKNYPTLPLHASTQLAVHSSDGVRALASFGFSRMVLSRELTLDEIRRIRSEVPDVELKVFIHGAMCYGFSGLCMASVQLTGRSANKGECSQICRTWFEDDEKNRGFFFSLKDLESDAHTLRELERIGIDSLKVEGRMKSPLYVASAARYYRSLLDGRSGEDQSHKRLASAFSRDTGKGFLGGYDKHSPQDNRSTESLITSTYAGHTGLSVGTIVGPGRYGENSYQVALSEDINLRDGLLIRIEREHSTARTLQFAASHLFDAGGNPVTALRSGEKGYLTIPEMNESIIGHELRLISPHDGNLPTHETGSSQPFRYPIGIHIELSPSGFRVSGENLPHLFSSEVSFTHAMELEKARSIQKTQENIESVFTSSGSPYLVGETIRITNMTGEDLNSLFLPSSLLKKVRNQFFELLDRQIETHLNSAGESIMVADQRGELLPERKAISPPGNYPLPYANLRAAAAALKQGEPVGTIFSTIDENIYLPLPPLFFDEEKEKQALDTIMTLLPSPVRIGINNPAHILWAAPYPDTEIFADIYLYIANSHTADLLLSTGRNWVGGYSWIERPLLYTSTFPLVMSSAGNDFSLPLFLSRSCYRYDVLSLPCEGCSRNHTYSINQNGNQYRVDVRECITTLTAQSTL